MSIESVMKSSSGSVLKLAMILSVIYAITLPLITNYTYIGGIMLNFTLTLDNPDSASTITISTHQGFEAEFPIHNGQANVQIFVPVSFASGQQIYIFLDK